MSRQDKAAAEKFYDKAKDILEKHTPLHLLLASCYYKLACLRDLESKREEALYGTSLILPLLSSRLILTHN